MSSEPTFQRKNRGRAVFFRQGSAAILQPVATSPHARRRAQRDPRWPQVVATLTALRERHRHAVRIVDAGCGCGTLLIAAVREAHALGFTAIEGRGIDAMPAMIGRARAAAVRLHDPAIGLSFDVADMADALAGEVDFPADILLCHTCRDDRHAGALGGLLAAAGRHVIGDPAPSVAKGQAA